MVRPKKHAPGSQTPLNWLGLLLGQRRVGHPRQVRHFGVQAEFARLVAELATGAPAASAGHRADDITVDARLVSWWKDAEAHYRRPDGSPANQLVERKCALKPLRALSGHALAKDFGPLGRKY